MPGWQTLEESLPAARAFCTAAVYRDFLYVLGGADEVSSPFTTPINTVLKARIQPDGKIGRWSTVATMSEAKLGAALLITPTGNMYVIGGDPVAVAPDGDDFNGGKDIWVGKLNADGNLQGLGLTKQSALPHSFNGAGIAVSREHVYLVGGVQNKIALDYDAQTGNFANDEVITGATSGATATIRSISDGGATGTLTLEAVSGTFVNDEVLEGDEVGRAVVNGTISAVKLNYDGQVVNFASGMVIKGLTSGAYGTFSADVDGGATGTLTLTSVTGSYDDNEKLIVEHADADSALSTNYFLDYDAQSGDFTVGQVVTGSTSNATGTIAADTDGGATGTLELTGVTGVFQDNEAITDPITGAATANGIQYKTLDYDAQTRNFATNQIVWGVDSGAKGTIQADTDGGTSGTLKLKTITGVFEEDEKLAVQYADANDIDYRTLAYDGQTGNFVEGETVTGATSGATLVIESDDDSGATGTLLADIVSGSAAFEENEDITSDNGSATADSDAYPDPQENLTIYRARIFSDGSLGAWTEYGVAPDAASPLNSLAVHDGVLYYLSGGILYWAKAQGERLDVWNLESAPATTVDHGFICVGDRLMLIGGDTSGTDLRTVRCRQLGVDGPQGSWYRTSDLPAALSRFGVASKNNQIFIVGGRATSASTTRVVSGSLNDGKVGGEKI